MTTSDKQVDAYIRDAHAAYEASRAVDPKVRAEWLIAIAEALEGSSDELVALAARETHLAEGRLRGELQRSAFQLRLFAAEVTDGETLDATIDHSDESWGMGPRPDIRRMNAPIGVVGVFGASNFPFAFSVMGGDSASALAAGCAVVHKIHEGHQKLGIRTSEIVTAALAHAQAPRGLFSTITGREAGQALVDHPLTHAIGFTGSTAAGRALFDRASARPTPIPFYGELGSINPVFVTKRAWSVRRESILEEFAASFTLGMGQFCTKPGLLFIPAADLDGVKMALEKAIGAQVRHPMLSRRLRAGFENALSDVASSPAVEVLIPGDDADAPTPSVLTTSATAVRQHPEILGREMFGPATLLVEYGDTPLIDLASLLEGQLTSTVQAEHDENIAALVTVLAERSGRVLWNAWPTGVTVSYAQQHGGPYPATTTMATSVGTAAIGRFTRPVAYQSFPPAQLPPALRDDNPLQIRRRVDGVWEEAPTRVQPCRTGIEKERNL